MKFTRSSYPDIPGVPGSPCWTLLSRWLYADADWNTRFPFGTSLGLHFGRQPERLDQPNLTPGFLLDLNAPEGEPNRLYLWLGPVSVTLGLVQFRDFRVTGRETTPKGRRVVRGEHFTNWRHPHIAGCDRYRYDRGDSGSWVRRPRPEPLHWGWLTVERHRAERAGPRIRRQEENCEQR